MSAHPALNHTYELNDGTRIPQIGLGTYNLREEAGRRAVHHAISLGYRLLDSAVNYENEDVVGQAISDAISPGEANLGLSREDLIFTTKIPGRAHERSATIECVENSLRTTGLDYLDIVLIHWPNPRIDKFSECFQALIDCRERGLIRTIGVSNFTPDHLARIIADTGVTPALNQIELHPSFPQDEARRVHAQHHIITQSWCPLGRTEHFTHPVITAIVERLNRVHERQITAAQVILRWQLQLGNLSIPKSGDPNRQAENLNIFDFELSDGDLQRIATLGRPDGRLFDADPLTHEEM